MRAGWETGPECPAIPADGVHVWHADLDAPPQRSLAELPVGERERAERIRSPLPRRRWVAARWALRRVLARYLGQPPAEIELHVGDRGKPSLAEPSPPLRFNLSHSGGGALIAVSGEREVGVDLELADPKRNFVRLAELGLDEEAAATVRAAPPRVRADLFYAAWVRREAIVKCHGVGLAAPQPNSPVSVSELEPLGGCWAAAVALQGPSKSPPQCFSLGDG